MIKNKNAQASRVFVYMLVVIIVGFTFIFGFKAINSLKKNADEVQFAEFKANTETKFNDVRNTFGDVIRPRIVVPTNFDEVCIGDYDLAETHAGSIDDVKIKGEMSSKSSNLFLRQNGVTKRWFDIGRLDILNSDGETTFLVCREVESGMIRLRLEGKGPNVIVSFIDVLEEE